MYLMKLRTVFFSIETQEDGLCVFGYRKDGETLCALHSTALEMGVPLEIVKPQVCILWPLAISDPPDEKIGVDHYAYKFSLQPQKKRNQPASFSPGIAENLAIVVGGMRL